MQQAAGDAELVPKRVGHFKNLPLKLPQIRCKFREPMLQDGMCTGVPDHDPEVP
jgi:hypothetical protein